MYHIMPGGRIDNPTHSEAKTLDERNREFSIKLTQELLTPKDGESISAYEKGLRSYLDQ
jgi:hypothetical protein